MSQFNLRSLLIKTNLLKVSNTRRLRLKFLAVLSLLAVVAVSSLVAPAQAANQSGYASFWGAGQYVWSFFGYSSDETPNQTKSGEIVSPRTGKTTRVTNESRAAAPEFIPASAFSALIDQSAGGGATETRSLRALALSNDDSDVFTGWLQNSNMGRKIRRYSTATANTLEQEVQISSLENAQAGRIQPRAAATDDRGFVYYGSGDQSLPSATDKPHFGILNANTLATVAKLSTIGDAATQDKRFGGVSLVKSGSTYFLYVTRESGVGEFYIQRFDVTTPTSPALDTTFGTNGTFNLAAVSGFSGAGFPRGLEVLPDGTIFATSNDTGSIIFPAPSTESPVI